MARAPKPAPGLPSKQQILDFIKESPTPAGKREIARAFGLKGQEKIKLKALLRKAAERTVDALSDTIGTLIPAFAPAECANFSADAGYDPE